MVPAERGPADPADEGPDDERCADARRRIAAFVRTSPPADEARALRAHLVRCEACAAAYRDALAGAARVGQAVREERVESGRERRHAELVRLSRGAAGRPSRAWLKLLVMTAALIFLVSRLDLFGAGAALRAERASGRVVAAGSVLGPDASRALPRGARCATGPGSRVALVAAATEIVLEPGTTVIVEDPRGPDGPRLRLLNGELVLSGPCVVTTQLGVATLAEGRARLELGETLTARCDEGALALVGPLGSRRLGPGGEVALGLDG